jgi:hypothetical protein
MTGYTIYFTYKFSGDDYHYSEAIHCNYINSLTVDTLANTDVNLYFNDINDFRFLADNYSVGGTGYTATIMYILLQVVDNSLFSSASAIQPAPDQWRIFDVTTQINNYTPGRISAVNLVSTVFKISLNSYNSAGIYNLNTLNSLSPVNYLNYPQQGVSGSTLTFGEETVFFGNVSTDIEAIAESMEIDIPLPAGHYNTTTNLTWDGISEIYISEVGIYDINNNLVAIGKFNTPVSKDATISRTIVFGIDF